MRFHLPTKAANALAPPNEQAWWTDMTGDSPESPPLLNVQQSGVANDQNQESPIVEVIRSFWLPGGIVVAILASLMLMRIANTLGAVMLFGLWLILACVFSMTGARHAARTQDPPQTAASLAIWGQSAARGGTIAAIIVLALTGLSVVSIAFSEYREKAERTEQQGRIRRLASERDRLKLVIVDQLKHGMETPELVRDPARWTRHAASIRNNIMDYRRVLDALGESTKPADDMLDILDAMEAKILDMRLRR